MKLSKDPITGLILPTKIIDEKSDLAKVIDTWLSKVIDHTSHIKERYFISFTGKFNQVVPDVFEIAAPVVSTMLPTYKNNQLVWFVCPTRGIVELLWSIPPCKKGEKMEVEFNKPGVAFLIKSGVMSS